jgi:hypothetical protein
MRIGFPADIFQAEATYSQAQAMCGHWHVPFLTVILTDL